jgi:hypothetical protein
MPARRDPMPQGVAGKIDQDDGGDEQSVFSRNDLKLLKNWLQQFSLDG